MAAAFREMHRVLRDDGCSPSCSPTSSGRVGHPGLGPHRRGVHRQSLLARPHRERAQPAPGAEERGRVDDSAGVPEAGQRRRGAPSGEQGSILLRCQSGGTICSRVREEARQKAAEFAEQGIRGVDLYISVFGPTLSIISEQWPVLTSETDAVTGQPRTLRPETALDLAREEVVRLRKAGLLGGREVHFDPVTDWYLMAWDAFGAEQFPYDEARKLAIALGMDLDKTIMAGKRLAAKKGEFIVLQTPVQRRRKGVVDDEVMLFECWIDAAHTAMMVYAEDGAGRVRRVPAQDRPQDRRHVQGAAAGAAQRRAAGAGQGQVRPARGGGVGEHAAGVLR